MVPFPAENLTRPGVTIIESQDATKALSSKWSAPSRSCSCAKACSRLAPWVPGSGAAQNGAIYSSVGNGYDSESATEDHNRLFMPAMRVLTIFYALASPLLNPTNLSRA